MPKVIGDRRRGENEPQVCRAAVVLGDPAQPTKDLGDVRSEHTSVPVALVHDHVPEPAEEPIPPAMLRQQAVVQHVGGGQQIGRVLAGAVSFGSRGVRVDHGGAQVRPKLPAERAHQRELVSGQRSGRRQIERSRPVGDSGERRDQVAD
jgi:hypothetical protein